MIPPLSSVTGALNVGPASNLASFAQALGPVLPTGPDSQVGLAAAEKTALGGGGLSFGQILANQIGNVQSLQSVADLKATQAATGDLSDIHDYMIASSEATLATDLTVAVRNKALEAFNEIMRMQL
jgi:flagellar hook-basal body complex protein FliE